MRVSNSLSSPYLRSNFGSMCFSSSFRKDNSFIVGRVSLGIISYFAFLCCSFVSSASALFRAKNFVSLREYSTVLIRRWYSFSLLCRISFSSPLRKPISLTFRSFMFIRLSWLTFYFDSLLIITSSSTNCIKKRVRP
jgi:hypothetical protein